jgi:hypothetical protein
VDEPRAMAYSRSRSDSPFSANVDVVVCTTAPSMRSIVGP